MDKDVDKDQLQQLKQFQKDKRNRVILSDLKLEEYLVNLQKYFRIDYNLFTQQRSNFKKEIQSIFLDIPDFYLEKDGIYSSENIQILQFMIHQKSLNNIAQKYFSIKTIRSYLYYGLLNAIVETTRTFFELDFSDKELLFRSNDSIEKTEFGMYFYILYIRQKYEKQLCILDMDPFSEILKDILEIDNKIINRAEDELQEIKRYYEYMSLGLLDRNLYLFQLASYVLKKLVKENELFYDFNQQKLSVDPKFTDKLKKCILSNKPFTLVPLTLEFADEETIHQNIILIDNDQLTAERFEPHGSTREKYENAMNHKLGLLFAKMGVEYIPHVCLKDQIQVYEYFVPDFLKGKCVTLSMDYLKYRLDTNLSRDKASLIYYQDVDKKGVIHWKEISEQNDRIFKQMQVYLDILNQTFQTSLKFNGTLLEF